MITGIEHIGLMVKSSETLAEWYIKTLEFREIFRTEGDNPIVFIAGAKSGIIEFIPYKNEADAPKEKDLRMHLAIAVDDFDQAMSQLTSAGVKCPDPPIELFNGGKAVFFQDPEGNWLHLVYRPESPWSV